MDAVAADGRTEPAPERGRRPVPRPRAGPAPGARALAVLVLAPVLGLAACGESTPDDLGGPGLPTLPADAVPGEPTPLTGVLHVEQNGCFTFEDGEGSRRWVVWPRGGRHEGDRVALPDGTLVGEGDRLAGSGVVAGAEQLPGWRSPGSYFASFGGYCDAGTRGVVILTEVRSG